MFQRNTKTHPLAISKNYRGAEESRVGDLADSANGGDPNARPFAGRGDRYFSIG